MYEACFGLQRRPFASVPCVEQYFPAAAIEEARQTLARCIERASGVGMIVGPSGTGKTLLCQILAKQFEDRFKVVQLFSGRLSTRRALLQAIQYELGQPYQKMDEGELRLALVDYLSSEEEAPLGMLLLVDEAHTLPLRLFEEIRMITNLVCDSQPRVRLVLAGGPLLEERLAHPKLESFSQRLVARCYLEPLTCTETEQFIRGQVQAAGGDDLQVFSQEACQAAYRASGGVPRIVNQVCDHALLLACAAGVGRLEAASIEEAWADLQQLPTPYSSDSRSGGSEGGVIEFGGLDEDGEEGSDLPAEAMAAEEDWEQPVESEAVAETPLPEAVEDLAEPEAVAEFDQLPDDKDEPVVAPRLHVAPGTEEPAGEAADPELLERLDDIEGALADMEKEFQPAGTIVPEVQIVLDDTPNPFDESFEEEEVLVERRLPKRAPSSHSSIVAAQPAPQADDESQEAVADSPVACEPAVQRDPVPEINCCGAIQQTASMQESVPDDLSFESEDAAAADEQPGADVDAPAQEPRPETVPLSEHQAEQDEEPVSDEDMIVVEEGYEDAGFSQPARATPVCRQEYRQLFARLRRG